MWCLVSSVGDIRMLHTLESPDGTHTGEGQVFLSGLAVRWCVADCECNTGDLALASTQPVLMELKLWLRTVTSFDFWVFNVWPVVASLFVNGYKGAEARDDARVGNLAKQEWVLVYAIDEATTAIPTSVLADIKRILEDKHRCTSKEERDAAMRRPQDLRNGEVLQWLMVKLGYTNSPCLFSKTPSAKFGR